jgi:hypothetical protein
LILYFILTTTSFLLKSQAPFPLEKIPLGSWRAGWQVADEEEGGGYQFVFKTPHSDGKHCLEAESKSDKNKWMEVLNSLLRQV